MSALIVDACVAAEWFTDEPFSEKALLLLEDRFRLHAPDFILFEFDSLVCKWVRRGIVTEREAGAARTAFANMPIQYHNTETLRDAAFRIAAKTGRAFYDCLYLALAVLLNEKLITADRKLYNAMRPGPLGKQLLWLGDISP